MHTETFSVHISPPKWNSPYMKKSGMFFFRSDNIKYNWPQTDSRHLSIKSCSLVNHYKHLTFLQHTNHKVNSHWISAACCQETFKNRRADICYLYLVKNASSGVAIEICKAEKIQTKQETIYYWSDSTGGTIFIPARKYILKTGSQEHYGSKVWRQSQQN